MQVALSRPDRARAKAALQPYGPQPDRSYAVEYFLGRWEQVVPRVEQGYPLDLDSYLNDLDARDILEELAGQLSEAGQSVLRAALAPWDQRFVDATQAIDGSLHVRLPRRSHPWFCRIPRVLFEPLRSGILLRQISGVDLQRYDAGLL
jgi:hypothetical protein